VTFQGEASFTSVTFKAAARFNSASFGGVARFNSAHFAGAAQFDSVTFRSGEFESATFDEDSWFGSTAFEAGAWFAAATFHGNAEFGAVVFRSEAWFASAEFHGDARFEEATFHGYAEFIAAVFHKESLFRNAIFMSSAALARADFRGMANFSGVVFRDFASYEEATFQAAALFGMGNFQGSVDFESSNFHDAVIFIEATFREKASFRRVTFGAAAVFDGTVFEGDTAFVAATFEREVTLGPFICAGHVNLTRVRFNGPMALSGAVRGLVCHRTHWASTAELRLRYTAVDLAHAVFEYPLTIAAEYDPFLLFSGARLAEAPFDGAPNTAVRMASLRGVDAAHLILADVDLAGCLFTGTVHLDHLQLEGNCTFDTAPSAAHGRRWRPVRFTQRRILAEEHHWRASQSTAVRGWNVAVFGTGHVGPAQLAPVYRALRKAFEDGKNEPGAADFYYGEMEMRRHDRTGSTRAERGLLHGYWLLSGYGLRASRAMGWLAAAMLTTIVLLMGSGLPQHSPKQAVTGTIPSGGGKVTFEIEKTDPQNPEGVRFTGERFEKALNVTLNSVVFRSSGEELTTTGTYIEMASRLAEPVLLGLAVLAIRNRVKR
jgi:uncharacterized protein YjbI with pentapeptide repeats